MKRSRFSEEQIIGILREGWYGPETSVTYLPGLSVTDVSGPYHGAPIG